jgi:phosphopantothenoylcysteine decarboxylase/phosphopantothenate--cysteine ligase
MAEPSTILSFFEADLESKLPLKGKKDTYYSRPTYEAIDPVYGKPFLW